MSLFKVGLEDPMSEERQADVDELIDWAAAKICAKRLELPATIFLEMHLPVSGLLHSAALLGQPILSPLFGLERFERLVALVGDRQQLRRLIERIQLKAVAKPAD